MKIVYVNHYKAVVLNSVDESNLRQRNKIETVTDLLKLKFGLIRSKQSSIPDYLINIYASLYTYPHVKK